MCVCGAYRAMLSERIAEFIVFDLCIENFTASFLSYHIRWGYELMT
jgi:hypothetical protein